MERAENGLLRPSISLMEYPREKKYLFRENQAFHPGRLSSFGARRRMVKNILGGVGWEGGSLSLLVRYLKMF